jgi:hypothetical protein
MDFVSPFLEISVFVLVAYVQNFFGFVLAFFACLMSFCQIPSFNQFYFFKSLTFSMFNMVCWFVVCSALLFSTTSNMPDYLLNTLNLNSQQVRGYLGSFIPYTMNDQLNTLVLDHKKMGKDAYFIIIVLFLGFLSGYLLYHLKLGCLADSFFNDQMEGVTELPPETTFKDRNVLLEEDVKDSHYINFFLKKIGLIFNLDPKQGLGKNDKLGYEFLKEIPYFDESAFSKKLKLYMKLKAKNEFEDDLSFTAKMMQSFLKFVQETLIHIFTLSNIVYAGLFAFIAFFFYFKNQNPSIFSFLSFIGVFLLGISPFKTFIFYSQFLVGVPMIFNFMMFYFSNLDLDIAKCKGDSAFYCQSWFGYINRKAANVTFTTLFGEMIVKIIMFQGIFFYYRMLKFSGDLFVEKTDREINLEIEDSFNRESLPFIRILIVQITSKFYIFCFLLMLYIGTSVITYTNMILLIMAITYMTKFKLVKKYWIFVYVIMNILFIAAYFIDLFATNAQKISNAKIFALLGLPINPGTSPTAITSASNALQQDSGPGKFLVMVLYVCCLIQQIAGRNRYIKCYLTKIGKIKRDDWLVNSMNNWKQNLKSILIKIYYKGGVWVSYGVNIHLPLFQSISIFRGILIITIIVTFLSHIKALKSSLKMGGKVDLNFTYLMWKIFLVLKFFNLSMLFVGAFGLTEQIRSYLNFIKDSQEYEFINFLGMESMEPQIIQIIPTLQNCSTNYYMVQNRLRVYFIIECVTFVLTKISMKIIMIEKIYHNMLHGVIKDVQAAYNLKVTKPTLFRVFKIYHRFITGSGFIRNKKTGKLMGSLSSFFARVYTSIIYFFALSLSIAKNISLMMFALLATFLYYFLELNRKFLKYLYEKSVERVIRLSKLIDNPQNSCTLKKSTSAMRLSNTLTVQINTS